MRAAVKALHNYACPMIALTKLQILKSIILSVAIDVMNRFFWTQTPPNELLNDYSMLKSLSAFTIGMLRGINHYITMWGYALFDDSCF
jgi:hypothetical protein